VEATAVRGALSALWAQAVPRSRSPQHHDPGACAEDVSRQTLWPEYRALAAELDAHLRELTERVIREAIDDDLSEAAEAPKALPAANR
jgi:hypothetical protein